MFQQLNSQLFRVSCDCLSGSFISSLVIVQWTFETWVRPAQQLHRNITPIYQVVAIATPAPVVLGYCI